MTPPLPPSLSGSSSTPQGVIITIDGPAGTGKSSVSQLVAKSLGLEFLDTGAMYRAAAWIVLRDQIDPANHTTVVDAVAKEDIHFDWSQDPPVVLCSNVPVSDKIRTPDVSRMASTIAAIPELRTHMVRKQQLIGAQHPYLVTEGRDQGTVVFPDAPMKLYLDATPRVRAQRRAEQMLRDEGLAADLKDLEQQIILRDEFDKTRSVGPLACPADAEVIDTTDLTRQQVVDTIVSRARASLADRLPPDTQSRKS